MAVDFRVYRAPTYRVAMRTLGGRWPGDAAIRREFEKVQRWARDSGLKTGKWFFREFGMGETSAGKMKWEMGIELRGSKKALPSEGVSIKTFEASTVVGVKFDPNVVSPSIIYLALGGWMRWTGREEKYKQNGAWREVYAGNPWKIKRTWASTEIQAPIKK